MAITFPRDFPSGIAIRESRFNLSPNSSQFVSVFTRSSQTQEHDAGRADTWEGVYVTPILSPAQIRELTAWIVSMQGTINNFHAFDADRRRPLSFVATDFTFDSTEVTFDSTADTFDEDDFPGTAEVNGASQTGKSLVTDGWGPLSQTVLEAGDLFQVETALYMVMEDVVTDGSGNATITIEPAIRTSPADNAIVKTKEPVMIARLSEPFQGWDTNAQKTGVISIAFEEDL